MNLSIQPKYFETAIVTCTCGNSFTVGATQPEIKVEVCYNCHPFYTGNMKFVDAAGRVDAFRTKMQNISKKIVSKTEKRKLKKAKKLEEEALRPESLEELRNLVN